MPNCIVAILSFVIILLIAIVYFSKDRIKNFETKIYSTMIIEDLLLTIFAILFYFTADLPEKYFLLRDFIGKGVCALLTLWYTLFGIYITYLIYNKKKKTKNNVLIELPYKILYIFFFGYIFLVTLIFYSPLYYYSDKLIKYSYGPAASLVFFGAFVVIILSTIIIILNLKNLFNKKFIPIYINIILGGIVWIIQKNNPGILLSSFCDTFLTLLMFFTIENPDMKLINELELAKINAEKANLAKTEFLSSMSHEIRTPLNAIVGFSSAILEDERITEAQEEAKDIMMASQNLLEIVNGILDISKIEAGKMEVVETEYNLKEMSDNIVKLVTPRILEKPIELKTTYANDLPSILYGDMGKMKEIITNLLTNATKYTDEGSIELSISCINNKNKSNLIISVEDTGRGIKPEKIDKLFTKFQRLEEDKNTTLEGTGLGLAITKSLIEMMGGKIIVQSKYGSGSKFTVYITQKIISMTEVKNEKKETNSNKNIDYSNKKILVVDDNNLNIKVAIRILDKYKIKPDTCTSGYECIEKVKNNTYDLILLDDMMPKMSGVETFKELKEDKNFKTPVVILTANAISGMKESYLKEGLNDYLAKPIEKEELERVLKKFLK